MSLKFFFVCLFETNVIFQQRLLGHVYNPAVYIIYHEAEVFHSPQFHLTYEKSMLKKCHTCRV